MTTTAAPEAGRAEFLEHVAEARRIARGHLAAARAAGAGFLYAYPDGSVSIGADPERGRGPFRHMAEISARSVASEDAFARALIGKGCPSCLTFEYERRERELARPADPSGERRASALAAERIASGGIPRAVALSCPTTCDIRHALEEHAIPERTGILIDGSIVVRVSDYGWREGEESTLSFNVTSASGRILRSFTNASSNHRAIAECSLYVLGFLEHDLGASERTPSGGHRPLAVAVTAEIALQAIRGRVERDDLLQCHALVGKAVALRERRLPHPAWAGLAPVEWDEARWEAVSAALNAARVPRFGNPVADALVADIADGSVNGHSFLWHPDAGFVDPYLQIQGVAGETIQRLDAFLLATYRSVGMEFPALGAAA